MQLLIEKGVNLEAESDFKRTALHIAAIRGNTKIAEILLKNFKNPDIINLQDDDLFTALHYATEKGFDSFVEILLKN